MSKKQWLVIVFLGIADCLVLGCLVSAMVLTPYVQALLSPGGALTEEPTASRPATSTLPPTWTSTLIPTRAPTRTPFPTSTRVPTRTPMPTFTSTPTPTVTAQPVVLQNADFEDIALDFVPGWELAAVVNWQPGDDFNPDTSYARPEFKSADDPRRVIRGSTLQIQTFQWVKFKVTLYQTVEVPPGSRVQFQIYANGFSNVGGIQVRAGLDPHGGVACQEGVWSEMLIIDQNSGVVTLSSPQAVAGPDGRVTVCFFAEPQYAAIHNAAFFDEAVLTVQPPD